MKNRILAVFHSVTLDSSKMKQEDSATEDSQPKIEFEPEDKLKKKPSITYLETIIHFTKAGVGAGIFSIAHAFSNVGWLLAIILTIFLSAICLYEQHVLLRCASNVRKFFQLTTRPDYGDTFQLAFLSNEKWKKQARKMKIITNIFLILTQLGFCAIYFVEVA